MWNEINSESQITKFMKDMYFFHDSCIKEIRYLSGAYVCDDLSMFPLNNRRVLRIVIQRQYKENSMIEMEFQGLKSLKLFPVDEEYTCEIFDSTLIMKDGYIYWCDRKDISPTESDDFTEFFVCATKLRWRSIENHMGDKEFYTSIV